MAASLVTSVLLISAMRIGGGVSRGRQMLDERAFANEVADGLVAEILTEPYADPATPATFGRESGELANQKANYDDVDDYDGYSETLLYKGRAVATDGLIATVAVQRAVLTAPTTDSATETGLKRITVTVTRQNRVLATRVVFKGDAP